MQEQTTDPMVMVRQDIAARAHERSNAHYDLIAAKRRVTQLEAVIAKCDAELAVLEQTQATLDRMTQRLAAQVAQAQAKASPPPPPLPVDGPPAHITQEVKAPPSRGGRKATGRKPTGRPPGRPKGSGVKPQKMQDEVTVAGYNGSGMTPGEAASE